MLKGKSAAIVAVACALAAGCVSAPQQVELVPVKTALKLRYPMSMAQQGREGDVVVDCTITTAGTTKDCVAVRSLGGAAFVPDALALAAQMRFEPVLRDGVPVEVPHQERHILFRLGDHPEDHQPI